jgi:putative alpha-1,2-mannosidase
MVRMMVFLAVAFLVFSVSVWAQVWPSADNIVSKAQAELNLESEQVEKVRMIIEENMAKRQEMLPQLEQGLTQAQAKPLDHELYNKLSEVLTRSQMNKWNRVLELMLQDMDPTRTGKL